MAVLQARYRRFELGSAEAARAFARDPRRRDALERAGVETADDLVLEEIEAR